MHFKHPLAKYLLFYPPFCHYHIQLYNIGIYLTDMLGIFFFFFTYRALHR